jgi:hypothetical protein
MMGIDPVAGREVQQLMDSTASAHGGRHREDSIHSLSGAALELAKRGKLTPERVVAASAHLVQDRMGDALNAMIPVRGPMRQPTKQLVEAALVEALRASRRRRR